MATKEEKQWMSDIASLGCVVCRNEGYGESPAEVHHIRSGKGKGQRASNLESIPLCPAHHRIGGYGIAFHTGKAAFIKRFGDEEALLEQTIKDVEYLRESIVGR
jgi:NADH:ubiquinone oxidoreductase subunit F (NADH-binding)